jgi:pyridoxal phosphate enzyme (YggS family)
MTSKLELIQSRIKEAAKCVGRDPDEVNLLAVSKGQSIGAIRELYAHGQRDFGENYAVEMAKKQQALSNDCPDIRWHFIGNIQTNKARLIAQTYMVHSVSNIRQAKAIALHRVTPLPVLLQVKLIEQPNRSGAVGSELDELLRFVLSQKHLDVRGLMAVLPIDSTKSPSAWFSDVKQCRDQLQAACRVELSDLSMGMSADFEAAIAQGATWVRIGTALFGPR